MTKLASSAYTDCGNSYQFDKEALLLPILTAQVARSAAEGLGQQGLFFAYFLGGGLPSPARK
ncbi:hypothetical protein [Comamonas sp. AG1104]|uniref:hypothetical protein n=1 Tax=Comamonas sp. AG1104 TaxID=2183900 RepID=UPI0011C079E6|nr:hypothetical protein [Comamonas sp. AG1104]